MRIKENLEYFVVLSIIKIQNLDRFIHIIKNANQIYLQTHYLAYVRVFIYLQK